jgi:hypothetical protein
VRASTVSAPNSSEGKIKLYQIEGCIPVGEREGGGAMRKKKGQIQLKYSNLPPFNHLYSKRPSKLLSEILQKYNG